MSFGNLQKMALQMQQNMQRVEEELAAAVLEGTAGGGVVRAAVTGKQQLLRVEIDPSAVDPADVEMLRTSSSPRSTMPCERPGSSANRRWPP